MAALGIAAALGPGGRRDASRDPESLTEHHLLFLVLCLAEWAGLLFAEEMPVTGGEKPGFLWVCGFAACPIDDTLEGFWTAKEAGGGWGRVSWGSPATPPPPLPPIPSPLALGRAS